MELKHLRYFIAAVEEGSLQGAAQRLNVAQPALSRRVRDLEAMLECALLVRSTRGVTPTPAGRGLYRDAVALVDDLNQAAQRARRLGLEQARDVRMGLAPTTPRKYAFLAEALGAFATGHPAAGIAFSRGPSTDLVGALHDGGLDMALIYEQRPGAPQLCERLVHRERYVLAVHPAHAMGRAGEAHVADLTGQPLVWLARPDMTDTLNPMLLHLRRRGLEPVIGQIADNPVELIDLTLATAGLCLIPASTMFAIPPGLLVFRAIPDLAMELDLTLAWQRDMATPAAEALLAELHTAIDRHQHAMASGTAAWSRLDHQIVFQPPA